MSVESVSLGSGTVVGSPTAVVGVARAVSKIERVVELMQNGVDGSILIVEEAAATGVAPIIDEAAGVICTSGGPTSHLALVSKEFGVPCLMGASLTKSGDELEGQTISIELDGSILLRAPAG